MLQLIVNQKENNAKKFQDLFKNLIPYFMLILKKVKHKFIFILVQILKSWTIG